MHIAQGYAFHHNVFKDKIEYLNQSYFILLLHQKMDTKENLFHWPVLSILLTTII